MKIPFLVLLVPFPEYFYGLGNVNAADSRFLS
jgi:hypothetical protein